MAARSPKAFKQAASTKVAQAALYPIHRESIVRPKHTSIIPRNSNTMPSVVHPHQVTAVYPEAVVEFHREPHVVADTAVGRPHIVVAVKPKHSSALPAAVRIPTGSPGIPDDHIEDFNGWMNKFCVEPRKAPQADVQTCCLGCWVPCALYGKTQWRLRQVARESDPLDSSWHSRYGCNGICWAMLGFGLICGEQALLLLLCKHVSMCNGPSYFENLLYSKL